MQEKVIKIIANQLYIDESEVTLDKRLKEDLHADSLDFVEMMIDFESEFDIFIEDEDAKQIKTVGDIVNKLKELGK